MKRWFLLVKSHRDYPVIWNNNLMTSVCQVNYSTTKHWSDPHVIPLFIAQVSTVRKIVIKYTNQIAAKIIANVISMHNAFVIY